MAFFSATGTVGSVKYAKLLGTGRSFNLPGMGITDYADLTVDNFLCEISSASLSNANVSGYSWPSGESYNGSYYTEVTKSYNPATFELFLHGTKLRISSFWESYILM